MRKLAFLLLLLCPGVLLAQAAEVELKNGTFQLGADGLPIDWKAYPPPNGSGTIFEAAPDGGLVIIDADKANGVGAGQWITVDPGYKYRGVLETTGGTGGVFFSLTFTTKIPSKAGQMRQCQVGEVQKWVEAGETGGIEGITPLEATKAWLWIYSPTAAKTDARVVIKSVKVEDLGAVPAEQVPAAVAAPEKK